ncbi:MAG: LLM class flavin-dependent oxidoreductase [Acidobacteria bacterium]|nr:LLM class flavin-dependent oxidoreductase [Acidobacteriota bacterium]
MRLSPVPPRAWFIGEGTLLVRCAELYLRAGHTVAGIASSDPSVIRWAETQGLQVVPADSSLTSRLSARPFEYLFSIVNLTRLDEDVIGAPGVRAVNFHDGPLPRYAGLHAPVWALINGETSYGVTWHEMTAEVDAGRILKQQFFEIPEKETSFGLNARCYEAGLQSFAALVDDITHDRLSPADQPLTGRSVYTRHQRPAGHLVIDWSRPAIELERTVRATDFGPYPNPFGVVRLLTPAGAYAVTAASAIVDSMPTGAGIVQVAGDERLVVGTSAGSLVIDTVRRLTGEPLALTALIDEAGIRIGESLAPAGLTAPPEETLRAATRAESYWLPRLADIETLPIPYATGAASVIAARARFEGPVEEVVLAGHDNDGGEVLVASVAHFLTRLAARPRAVLPLAIATPPERGAPLVADRVPMPINLSRTWTEARSAASSVRHEVEARGAFLTDLCLRHPDRAALRGFGHWRTHIVLDARGNVPAPRADDGLIIRPGRDGRSLVWDAPAGALPEGVLARLHAQWMGFMRQAAAAPDVALSSLPLVDNDTRQQLIETWNDTTAPFDRSCIHELVERQAARTPETIALVSQGTSLSYRELNARANRFARHLQALGVGPESRVGICLDRTTDLVISLLAVLKAGGAYVPLDPHYPQERLALVTGDAEIRSVIVEARLIDQFAWCDQRVCPTRDRSTIDSLDGSNLGVTSRPENLAYVIYTSGSTGAPKGVMLEHRQVANFFAGMDGCVPHDPPGTWLSVTSISFDISVLELFWTLARGFTVVLYTGESGTSLPAHVSTRPEPIDLSLFYFSADEGQDSRHKYRLLIEGAKFADTHGFSAVWTPERHFHAFGGLYPNPAVTGAAVAAVTSRVGIRAGSCVLPLHHPLRIAEEWSVVDNISGGRVGIAFAAGWQPNDFVLRPDNYTNRKQVLFEGMATVQALWRGEAITLTTPRGEQQSIRTLPRPVQPTLPVWITVAGNPDTFAAAAAAGAGVLTHLLGQTVDELATKVAAYRTAWTAAGHAGRGHVVLMLHTLVADDDHFVRDVVREPLMAYLRTSIDLVKPFAESFPTFAARSGNPSEIFAALSEEDYDALVEHSFERYFATSGLFGRPETCLAMIDRLKALGVDEVACLVDFGVPTDVVLANLPHLHSLLQRANGVSPDDDDSIAGLIARHGVTHLQCTPSMARMLLLDPATRTAIGRLRAMFVGGEALPAAMAAELCTALGRGELWNMYGPTETTVWSTVARITSPVEQVTIGRPIANTRIYILDATMQPVPVGLPGDLYIGGSGVARGYWNRPDLTNERFRPDPFVTDPDARIYATGDIARYRDDGSIEFLGRSDQQVKIRGHRIELGEIESALVAIPGIREAVVVAREDHTNDKRLVAYVIPDVGAPGDGAAIRRALASRMPDFLVPSHVVFLDNFPLTPNNKVDRRALPAVEQAPAARRPATTPSTEMEHTVVQIWRDVLRTAIVSADDNFFDIGGDSLLAAQVLSQLRGRMARPVSLTDLFRFPTVRALAAHLSGEATNRTLATSTDRARARQDALKHRRSGRTPAAGAGDSRP